MTIQSSSSRGRMIGCLLLSDSTVTKPPAIPGQMQGEGGRAGIEGGAGGGGGGGVGAGGGAGGVGEYNGGGDSATMDPIRAMLKLTLKVDCVTINMIKVSPLLD